MKSHLWWIWIILGLLAGTGTTGFVISRAPGGSQAMPEISDEAFLTAESAYLAPQIQKLLEEQRSPLAKYKEKVGEQTFSAAELFWMASQNDQFGLSPKALLTTFAIENKLAWEKSGGLFDHLRQMASTLNDAYRAVLTGGAKASGAARSGAERALAGYFAGRAKSPDQGSTTLQGWAETYQSLFDQSPRSGPKEVQPATTVPFLRLPFERAGSRNYPLEAWFDHAAPGQINETKMLRFDGIPLPGAHYTGCWQWVTCYSGHNATDYTMPTGTPIYAAAAGTVVTRIDSEGGLVIDHNNGYRTIYWHLDRIALTQPYQVVKDGQLIGWSGNRGTSPHPHLHFGLRLTALSRDVDPFGWIGDNYDPWVAPSRWMWRGDAVADDTEAQSHIFYGPEWVRTDKGYQGGAWYTSATQNPNNSTNWGIWGTYFAKAGTYPVSAYWPKHPDNTTSATFKIQTARGWVSVTVDQRADGDRWVPLGRFEMKAGSAVVILTDVTKDSQAERRVVFDAIRWGESQQPVIYLPAITK